MVFLISLLLLQCCCRFFPSESLIPFAPTIEMEDFARHFILAFGIVGIRLFLPWRTLFRDLLLYT